MADGAGRAVVSRTYVAPTSVEEALTALAAGSRPVAGGTDLVVGARQGKAPLPEQLLAIHRIEALGGITESGDGLRLGTLVTHRQIVDHPVVRARFTALADASAIVGSHATRAQGTIGGNVMNASPAMDTGGPLLCFGATVTLRSTGGERVLALDDLWLAPGRTAATPDELLVAVDLPLPAEGSGSCYVRLEYRRQMEIAVVGASAVVTLDGGAVSDARVAITALSATIRRIPEAERGSDRLRRRPRRRRGGLPRGQRRILADQRRPRLGRLPAGDGGRDRASRHHGRARSRAGRCRSHPRRPRAARRTSEADMKVEATLTVNGTAYPVELDPHMSLLRAVRDVIGLTGSKEGCDDSECGACMMLLDSSPVNACSYLALQAEGRQITTVEGLAGEGLAPLQAAFLKEGGVQCGFCTPGMLISATALLRDNPDPSEDEVRLALAGNLCRCTGYDGIVRAVRGVAQAGGA